MDHTRSFSNQNQIGVQFNVKWDYVRPKLSDRKCASKTNGTFHAKNYQG